MKILLVDDDAFLRDMYVQKFEEAKHEVDSAKTGREALRLIEQKAYDVILLDMVMPGMDGVELMERIKEEGHGPVRCIVLSNQGEQSDISAAESAGAVGYIVKAESIPSEVVEKVESLVT